jgi:hypothetical protein
MRARHGPLPQDRSEKSGTRLTRRGDKLPHDRSPGGDLGASVTRENVYYLIIGALAIVFAAITYHVYQEHKLPEGVHFHLGPNGLSIEKK